MKIEDVEMGDRNMNESFRSDVVRREMKAAKLINCESFVEREETSRRIEKHKQITAKRPSTENFHYHHLQQ